jgi:anti-anti-sigma factor
MASANMDGAVAHLELDGAQRASLVIDGDFDIAGEPHARLLLREATEAHVPDLEIDFCAATFVDCSAVRLALQAREAVDAYGGHLRVRAPRPVQRVFDLTSTASLVELVRC